MRKKTGKWVSKRQNGLKMAKSSSWSIGVLYRGLPGTGTRVPLKTAAGLVIILVFPNPAPEVS
jgi:hypothetical protein